MTELNYWYKGGYHPVLSMTAAIREYQRTNNKPDHMVIVESNSQGKKLGYIVVRANPLRYIVTGGKSDLPSNSKQ